MADVRLLPVPDGLDGLRLDVAMARLLGLSRTAAGTSTFPGLTNADRSSGPGHNYCTTFGALPVLATGSAGQAVIIGGSGGSITAPPPGAVPEPATWAMMLLGFGMIGTAMRRSRKQTVRYSAV
mgnify:CR=1 FL=1